MIFLFMIFSGKDFTEFVRFFDSLCNNEFLIIFFFNIGDENV